MSDDLTPEQAREIENLKARVLPWLTDFAGGYEVDSNADAFFRMGSARINLRFSPFGDQTLIRVFTYLLWGVPRNSGIVEHVAFNAAQCMFGALQLLPDSDDEGKVNVIFDHSILGDYVDYEEFKNAVLCVAISGDRIDTELHQQFGGELHYEDWDD